MRNLTPKLQGLYSVAQANSLPNALGRAIYAQNRIINGGIGRYMQIGNMGHSSGTEIAAAILQCMQKCKPATAKRWLAHFLQGGSVKALRYKSHAAFLGTRRAHYAKYISVSGGKSCAKACCKRSTYKIGI